jgi:hypothetical protein
MTRTERSDRRERGPGEMHLAHRSSPPADWRTELHQAVAIARATFGGFLQSDVMPQGLQASATIWAAAFLAAPAMLLSAQFLGKYTFLERYYPQLLERAIWNDRGLFILLSSGAIGIVSVVMWDTLFPGRRDVFVLGSLPVRPRVQALGRLGSLLALFGTFATALNLLPAVTFSMISALTITGAIRGLPAHLTACLAADAFVFFGLTMVQGVLLVGVGRRASERLAPVAQVGTVLIVLLTLLFIGPLREATAVALERGNASDPILRWFPLAWFVGIYEVIGGTSRPIMWTLAARGIGSGVVPLLGSVGLYLLAYRRLCARAIETPARSSASPLSRAGSAAIRRLLVRHPAEQAICSFTLRVLARSRRHRMLMAIYVGGGLALIIAAIVPAFLRNGASAFATPSVASLGPPLILSAALAVGFRALLAIPVDLGAGWIFRTCSLTPFRVGAGVHKAGLLLVIAPVALTAWASAAVLWDASIAWRHAVFCASLSLLLLELLLLKSAGMPFARQYIPGASRFHLLWPFYLSCFLVYTYSAAESERLMLREGGLVTAVTVVLLFAAGLAAMRWWTLWHTPELSFEVEVPDEIFRGFNLSEGLAAHAVATRHADGPSNFTV